MTDLQALVLRKLREGFDTNSGDKFPFEAREDGNEYGSCDQWVMSVSISEYETHNPPLFMDKEEVEEYTEREGTPTHTCRVVFRTRWDGDTLELVDGEDLYLQVDMDGDKVHSIWEDKWQGNQPSYYGGPIDTAREWVSQLGEEFYVQMECPWE